MMSLDVYLSIPGLQIPVPESNIPVRENGQTRIITRQEWDERFPGREPVTVHEFLGEGVYTANITHNLNKMAIEAGLYEHLWRPEEVGIELAVQLIDPLKAGLETLKADPERFKQFNPQNGWGTYEGLVRFIEDYLQACEKYPNAQVSASR